MCTYACRMCIYIYMHTCIYRIPILYMHKPWLTPEAAKAGRKITDQDVEEVLSIWGFAQNQGALRGLVPCPSPRLCRSSRPA